MGGLGTYTRPLFYILWGSRKQSKWQLKTFLVSCFAGVGLAYPASLSRFRKQRANYIANPQKLETGFRTISAGIPYTLLIRIEAIGIPTFGLLLYTYTTSCRISGTEHSYLLILNPKPHRIWLLLEGESSWSHTASNQT